MLWQFYSFIPSSGGYTVAALFIFCEMECALCDGYFIQASLMCMSTVTGTLLMNSRAASTIS